MIMELSQHALKAHSYTVSLIQPKAKLYAREQGMQAMPYERETVSWKAALQRSLYWTSKCTPASSAMPRSSGTEACILACKKKRNRRGDSFASLNSFGAAAT